MHTHTLLTTSTQTDQAVPPANVESDAGMVLIKFGMIARDLDFQPSNQFSSECFFQRRQASIGNDLDKNLPSHTQRSLGRYQ